MDCEGLAPSGMLTSAEGLAYRFSGWTELAAAIEEWRSEARAGSSPNAAAEAAAPRGVES